MAMLKRDDAPFTPAPASGDLNALLGRGSEFEGKLTFEGTVRIDGKFTGNIVTNDVLVVGEGAKIQGAHAAASQTVEGQLGALRREFNNLREDIGAKFQDDLRALIGWDARAIVAHFEQSFGGFAFLNYYLDLPAAVHGLDGVDQEVEEHLAQESQNLVHTKEHCDDQRRAGDVGHGVSIEYRVSECTRRD